MIAAIAGIIQIAEVWFPYNRFDRLANFSAILAIPAIIWKPGFSTMEQELDQLQNERQDIPLEGSITSEKQIQ